MTDSPVVTVNEGQLQGRLVNSPSGKAYYTFQGIPYAKPPLGSLRFKAPQPAESWEGIRDATTEGNTCSQVEILITNEYQGDENCLFLNVSTPTIDGEFLPVMVKIHGGGFRSGTGSPSFYGPDYLVEKDVVIVTLNYRLGPLGFLCLNTPEVPGNAGLKDIALALQWVKENIKSFGGNSANITVMGHSAGAAATELLRASPLTRNLINKVIVQSGPALGSWVIQNHPIDNARALAKALGCETSDVYEIQEFLTTTPVRDLAEAFNNISSPKVIFTKGKSVFSPVVEREFPGVTAFLTEPYIDVLTSGRLADIPTMIGFTTLEFAEEKEKDLQEYVPPNLNIAKDSEESLEIAEAVKKMYFKHDLFTEESLEDEYNLVSDLLVHIDMHRNIKFLLNTSNKPIYYYRFDYVGENNFYAESKVNKKGLKFAGHGDELGYLFKVERLQNIELTPQDVKLRERLVRLWTNFAKEGNPTPDVNHYLNVPWPPVTKDTLYCLSINNELVVIQDPDKEKMEFWENIYSKYYKIWEQPKTNEDNVVQLVETTSSVPVIIEDTVATIVQDDEDEVVETAVEKVEEFIEKVEEVIHNNVSEVDEKKDEVDVPAVDIQVTSVQTPEVEPIRPEVEQKVKEVEVNVVSVEEKVQNGDAFKQNGSIERKPRPSNEIKMVQPSNVDPKDVIRANDPPEDDLPKNIGVNKFVNFFESLGGKK